MPIEITMPRLSDTMQQGTVVKWNVKEGDAVKAGQILADIETDKATMELESFDAGVVAAIVAAEGQNVAVGGAIVVLASQGEDPASIKSRYASAGAPQPALAKAAANTAHSANGSSSIAVAAPPMTADERVGHAEDSWGGAEGGGRIFASPLARKLAEDLGVDLARVRGTGPAGRIIKADIEHAAAGAAPRAAQPPPAATAPGARPGLVTQVAAPSPMLTDAAASALEDRTLVLSNMRRTIAQRLVQSKTTIPHYQVTVSVNMDPLLALREQLNEQLASQGVKLSVNDFLVRACALAMHQHPHVNSAWDEAQGGANIRLLGRVNIGVAISLPIEKGGGLVVATIRDADRLGLRGISTQTKALAEKARTRGLTIDEMADSTFTISNLGMYGVEHFTAIINPPNAAILAVGAAVKKPVVRPVSGADQVVIGHEMQMTMSSDHRIVDGAMAAQYLASVKQLLESPATLLV